MIDYSGAISKGLRFGVNPKRWLQFFILDLIFLGIGASIILPNIQNMGTLIAGTQDVTNMFQLAGMAVSVLAIVIVWVLVRIWFAGAMIHQSNKEKDKIGDSYRISCRKYPSLFMATLIVSIIGVVVGMIPYYVGLILSIIVSWLFFFILQGVIVSKLGFSKTIGNSYKIFRGKPLKVFLAWLLITIITTVIYLIFTLPIMATTMGIFVPQMGLMGMTQPISGAELLSSIAPGTLQSNIPMMLVGAIIALIGFAIATTFALKAQTEFYNQFKKKFKII